MLKTPTYNIVFREFPDETTLAINISGCPNRCPGCHSDYLQQYIGRDITPGLLTDLLLENSGITCIGFMGGDSQPDHILNLAEWLKKEFPQYKIGWYRGIPEPQEEWNFPNIDYIKWGPYIKEKGPLDNPNTNQRMYMKTNKGNWVDITKLFWGNH